MRCLAHQHENAPEVLLCRACGSKISALAEGLALPYGTWELVGGGGVVETALSVSAPVRDRRSDEVFEVREYFPSSPTMAMGGRDEARVRGFIRAARSLRGVAAPGMRVRFAYTAGSRWYTVSEPRRGTPLREVVGRGRVSAGEVRKWFRAMMVALRALHGEVIETGPLYHGDVRLGDMLVQERETGYRVELVSAIYLEQFAAETPLPPEHYLERDLRGAALAALELLDGRRETGDQTARLDAVADQVLGATLDYVLRPGAKAPGSAERVLAFFDDLSRAEAEGSKVLYQAAYQASGSGRLRAVLNAPAVAPPPLPPRPAAAGDSGGAAAASAAGAAAGTSAAGAAAAASWGAASPSTNGRERGDEAAGGARAARADGSAAGSGTAGSGGDGGWTTVQSRPQAATGKPVAGAEAKAATAGARRRSLASRIGHLVGTTLLLLGLGVGALVLAVVLLVRSLFSGGGATPPSIAVEPGSVHRGQSSRLRWSAKGFEHAELNGEAVQAEGSRSVSPSSSTTYRLRYRDAQGKAGSTEARLVVTPAGREDRRLDGSQANGRGGRPGLQAAAARDQINFGESTELRWAAANAASVTAKPAIEGEANPLPAQGSANVSPAVTTTYLLSAQGDGGRVSRSVVIRVVPRIVSFEAQPAGDGCTWVLDAEVQGARRQRIEPAEGMTRGGGRLLVRPLRDTTYTLSAEGQGTTATSEVQIRVSPESAARCAGGGE